MKACWWGQNFFYNLVLANLARLFHPAMSFRDCLWFTEKWNTQSRRHSRKQLWYAACISVFPDRDFLNPKWVPKCCAVQVPRSHVRNMPTLERTKVHLLGFSQTLKGFITSAIMRRGTGFLIWYSCSCRLVPRVSCVPVARPGVIGQWGGGGGGSEHGVWDPRQNLWPFRRSRIAENTVNLPWLFSIFQLLVVGASVPLCSFNTASLSPLSQLPLVFFSSSLCPNLTTREQRQRSGYLRISVFVEIHRQGRERSSRYSRPHESRGARCYPVPKEKAFFANVLVATTLELKLGGHDPCSNFVNEQFLNFVFK